MSGNLPDEWEDRNFTLKMVQKGSFGNPSRAERAREKIGNIFWSKHMKGLTCLAKKLVFYLADNKVAHSSLNELNGIQ